MVILKIFFWGFVALCIGNSILKKINGEPEYSSRAQSFYNTNRTLAAESVCDAVQEIRNPEICSEMAEEKFQEFQARSRIYYE